MDQITRDHITSLQSTDVDVRYLSYQYLMEATKKQVDWAYEIWDDLLRLTTKGDNHQRTIAVQLLSNLAKSDPQNRMVKDLDKLIAVTKDEKFVTARHSLQSLWNVGIASDALRERVVEKLSDRFHEAIDEKNTTLVRYDILEVFRKIFDHTQDENLPVKVRELIQSEKDPKYRNKYSGLWKRLLSTTKEQKL